MDIKKDTITYDEFIVMDESDNPVTGLLDGVFTRKLYDPDKNEVSGTISVTISEIGDGLYRVSFTPNKLGNWVLIISNTTYFPWGKGDSYRCVTYITGSVVEYLQRILGLSQENYRVINPQYDGNNSLINGKIKIYPTATDCNNNTNHIAEYQITATYDSKNRMSGYKVIKL